MTTARLEAARVLLTISKRASTLGATLDEAAERLPDARDRALLVELATGTLRWQRELDALIAAAAQRAARTLDAEALVVLRLGTYQLRHLDRIPSHAIVSSSVDTVRLLGAPRAAGFVNAVLRSMIRRGPSLSLPKRPDAEASRERQLAYLSVTLSHPTWLVERWLDRYGFDATVRWCEFNNRPPDVTVRPLDMSAEALVAELHAADLPAAPAPFVRDAVVLPAGTLGKLPEAIREHVYVQDEGAQLVARVAAATKGERVLDLCAAPGGKSLILAADMAGGLLVSADYRPARVALLSLVLGAADRRTIVRLDARAPLPFLPTFDCVLADVPCSGLGTLRREPDLKWTRSADDLPALAAEALQILRAAAQVVQPGGRLIYATCSSEPDENGDVVDQFLAEERAFSERAVGTETRTELVDGRGRLVTRPDLHGLDAFFAAVLVRAPAP